MRFCPLFLCLIVILPLSGRGSATRGAGVDRPAMARPPEMRCWGLAAGAQGQAVAAGGTGTGRAGSGARPPARRAEDANAAGGGAWIAHGQLSISCSGPRKREQGDSTALGRHRELGWPVLGGGKLAAGGGDTLAENRSHEDLLVRRDAQRRHRQAARPSSTHRSQGRRRGSVVAELLVHRGLLSRSNPRREREQDGRPSWIQAGQIQGRAVEGCGSLGDGNEQPTSWPRGAAPGWRVAAPGVEGAPGGGWQRLGWRAPRARRRKPLGEELAGGSSRSRGGELAGGSSCNPSRQRRDERAPECGGGRRRCAGGSGKEGG